MSEHERLEAAIRAEWAEWPQQRWAESMKLWQAYLSLGGSLDPDPDPQSPFFDEQEWRELSAHGWPSLRAIRHSGV